MVMMTRDPMHAKKSSRVTWAVLGRSSSTRDWSLEKRFRILPTGFWKCGGGRGWEGLVGRMME